MELTFVKFRQTAKTQTCNIFVVFLAAQSPLTATILNLLQTLTASKRGMRFLKIQLKQRNSYASTK